MIRLLLLLAAVAGPPPPHAGPVVVAQPASYEIWDGTVAGHAPAGTSAVVVSSGRRRWAVPVRANGAFRALLAPVPRGDLRVSVAGREAVPVYGVPRGSIRTLAAPDDDRPLDVRLRSLADEATPHVGIYARTADGAAAAYNAGGQFEAASTLKLPAMLTALSTIDTEPSETPYWNPFLAITRYSDNTSANEVLEMIGGSEPGGAARMVAFCRALGMTHTYMAGGYLVGAGGGPPTITVVDPPPDAYKHTTPADMAELAADLADAAAGRGPLPRHGVSPHEARELLYLMVHAQDPGLVPAGAGGLPVAHKIGWLTDTDNDVAVVFTRNGPAVITIYTEGDQDGTAQRFGADATRAVLAAAAAGRR